MGPPGGSPTPLEGAHPGTVDDPTQPRPRTRRCAEVVGPDVFPDDEDTERRTALTGHTLDRGSRSDGGERAVDPEQPFERGRDPVHGDTRRERRGADPRPKKAIGTSGAVSVIAGHGAFPSPCPSPGSSPGRLRPSTRHPRPWSRPSHRVTGRRGNPRRPGRGIRPAASRTGPYGCGRWRAAAVRQAACAQHDRRRCDHGQDEEEHPNARFAHPFTLPLPRAPEPPRGHCVVMTWPARAGESPTGRLSRTLRPCARWPAGSPHGGETTRLGALTRIRSALHLRALMVTLVLGTVMTACTSTPSHVPAVGEQAAPGDAAWAEGLCEQSRTAGSYGW